MKKFITILLIAFAVSCEDNNANSSNINDIPLTENEKIYYYDIKYFLADDGEYLNIGTTEDSENLGFIYYDDSAENLTIFQITSIDGNSITGESSYGGRIISGNFESDKSVFRAIINNEEINFRGEKSLISGAKLIEYIYTNVSTNETDRRTFEYGGTIFALNNENKSDIIDKINLDINSDFNIKNPRLFDDLTKQLKNENLISNGMYSNYSEWELEQSEYPYDYASYSGQYKIDYLNENIISLHNYIYDYMGGAHGNYATIYKVYSLDNGERLKIEDILINVNDENLLNMVKEKLLSIEGMDENSYFDLNELTLENNNFYITSKGLAFTWGIYEIAPYAMGESKALMSIEEIKPYLKEEYKNIF